MDKSRAAVTGAILTIVIGSVLTGPAVGIFDVSTPQFEGSSLFCDDGGTAKVSVEYVPVDSFVIEKPRFGSAVYSLVPRDTQVHVHDIKGCPKLRYELDIPALGYTSQKVYYLDNSTDETLNLTFLTGKFEPEELKKQSYDGTVRVVLNGTENRIIFERNISIPIEGRS